ncbi:MAG: ABC transporter permease [bacterium]|nr:ABC transporter permease [bacterium]
MNRSLMWKLLRKHISKAQLIGFSLANLVGLSIVILAVQFYCDVLPVFNDEESFISKDYLIITRNLTSAGALMGGTTEFSPELIADIKAQPWCRKVAPFVNSEFAVTASIGVDNAHAMRTQFFFESIPSEFIDVDPTWKFNPDNPTVPVIMSRDYLSLYNFGFASTQGMPQISESEASSIPLVFNLAGNGLRDNVQGRIVGFSNRLNTIIVPEEFMEWANKKYGQGGKLQPLRLIIEVNRPGDPAIQQYMDEHQYNIAGDKTNSGKTYYFLTLIVSIVVIVGVLISLLSFFVLMLSIYLLLQKNTRKLQDLLMLGYSPQEVSRPYIKMVLYINGAVLVLALVLMFAARASYMVMLSGLGTKGGTIVASIVVAVAIMASITTGNVLAIRRKIRSLWIRP